MNETRSASEDLLLRIAGGDAEAVSGVLSRYGPLVWSLARRLWRDVASLDDVVQEIFIDVWKSAGRFDPVRASEATFIATIARRRIIDRRRRSMAGPAVGLLEEANGVEPAGEPDAGLEGVDLGDEASRARAALDVLDPERRRVILMSVVDGLTHREISASTGLPLGTVKSHIRRGLASAAEALGEPGGGEEP